MSLLSRRIVATAQVAHAKCVASIPAHVAGLRQPAAAAFLRGTPAASRPLHVPPQATTPTPHTPSVYLSGSESDNEIADFQRMQTNSLRPSAAEEARTVLDQGKHGVLCTLSSAKETAGFPASSVVEFACDGTGRPFFATSALSSHTADMEADGRVSLTVNSPSFQGMDCGRLTLQGSVAPVPEAEKPRLREIFLKKYPSAFYVDFGDFKWFRVDKVAAVRFNGGFGRAPKLTVDDYLAAKPDPVYAFSSPVCGHMNADHMEDGKAMVKHYCGLTVDTVRMLDLDRLGINCSVTRKGETFKIRLPFPHPVNDRKGIKDAIVEMTKKARSAAALNARTPGGTGV